MDKIVYMGIDLGSEDGDKSCYGLYDNETGTWQEITEEEYNRFVEVVNNPPEPNEALKQLMKKEWTGYFPLNVKPEWL